MHFAPSPYADTARLLAPFMLLSLLLHIVFFMLIRPVAKNFDVNRQHAMEVYLSTPSEFKHPGLSKAKIDSETRGNPAKISTLPEILNTQPTVQTKPISTTDEVPSYDIQHLMDSAKNIAQDEARKSAQDNAAQEEKKLHTPAGSLAQYLKQPYKEIRLANGMLKIISAEGAVCYHPVPYFAHDSADVFNIPTLCP